MSQFTFARYREIFQTALRLGYSVITLSEYFRREFDPASKVLINRIDVDYSVAKARTIGDIFARLGIRGTFFLRLHAPEYNLLAFDNFITVKRLVGGGNEVGLHSELEDMAAICGEDPERLLRREIELFEGVFETRILGSAAHGDHTGFNNLDFWKERDPEDFGLLYEAYDETLWKASHYISDSEWTRWKSYEGGELREGDRRDPIEHMEEDAPGILYLLTHSDSYYSEHFHEA